MDSSGGASLASTCPDARKRRVSYFYEPTIGDYDYGQGHPMKPHRLRMAHDLIVYYSLHRRMEIIQPFPAASADICRFHSPDYVEFLSSVTPNMHLDRTHVRHLKRFNFNEDCPVFDGLFSFCQASAGGSIGAAVKLNRQDSDIAINWAGGLHHAKKSEASGFCYVNDIVLGILELLKVHRRVLYIDIDIHHGDGVEEAFYDTDRVMTVSFHKFGDFFPSTGHIKDIGEGAGKYYAVNVPLKDGINDDNFRSLFRPIIHKVMDVYQPDVVVLQCGADSLAGDRLGCFNLSIKGHADCLRYLRSFNVPLMVLGGGGYTICNVARCWCYETAVAVDVEPDNKLPYNEYYEYFGPDYTLHLEPNDLENLNTECELEKIRNMLLDQLSQLQHVPSVPFQTMPSTTEIPEEREENIEVRSKPRSWNSEEYYESDDDENEKLWQRTVGDKVLQAGIKEKFQKKSRRRKGKEGKSSDPKCLFQKSVYPRPVAPTSTITQNSKTPSPAPEITRSGIKCRDVSGIGKGKMVDENEVPKSSVQTQIDLHMEQVNAYAAEEISFFDEWVNIRVNVLIRDWNLDRLSEIETLVFAAAKIENVGVAKTRRAYILETLKVKKLREILTVLQANYDYQSPAAFHDAAVIKQLSINLMNFDKGVTEMEMDFKSPVENAPPSDAESFGDLFSFDKDLFSFDASDCD